MAVPRIKQLLFPLLGFLASDQNDHTVEEAAKWVADEFNLSNRDLKELTRGGNPKLEKTVAWALHSHLQLLELIERTEPGRFQITRLGIDFLELRRRRGRKKSRTATQKGSPA
jgi:restriction endonuclease Mrr